jgi:F-type H+-transporting ATPase subunit epsilon
MKLTILSPEKAIFEGDITSVKVPGAAGQFEVLNHHAALVSALKDGEIRVIDAAGARTTFMISSGFIEVLHNNVSIAVQGAN